MRMFRGIVYAIVAALVFLSVPADAQADPVAEAYRAIPHNQTTYSAGISSLPSSKAKMIEKILSLSDQALVERIKAGEWLISGGKRGRNFTSYEQNIRSILTSLAAAETTTELEQPKTLIIEAIEAQRTFLVTEYNTAYAKKSAYRWPAGFRDDPNIQTAHQKLIQAYQLLHSTYPEEAEQNQKAFFDHLCALDYI